MTSRRQPFDVLASAIQRYPSPGSVKIRRGPRRVVVQLAAEVLHEHPQPPGRSVACSEPQTARAAARGDELAAVGEEHFEQPQLGRRQRDRLACPRDLPSAQVDHQIAGADHDAATRGRPGAAEMRARAREQLGGLERLHHVVVGARLERGDLVGRPSRTVSTTTGTSVNDRRCRRVIDPSMPGSPRSSTTRSRCSFAPKVSASSPRRASATSKSHERKLARKRAPQLRVVLDQQHPAHVPSSGAWAGVRPRMSHPLRVSPRTTRDRRVLRRARGRS